jgi:hypothetical protein
VDTEKKGTPAVASAATRLRVISYPQHLINLARRLIDDGEFNVSVVVSHMACEIATERCFLEFSIKKGIKTPRELNGYNLMKNRRRETYTSLTGDAIEHKPFWLKFKESVTRRHNIIHRDYRIGKVEAEESFSAATDFVAHLESL